MFNPQDDRWIPVLMATQHPDNAGVPFWKNEAMIRTRDEVQEIYESFFTLGCGEYMWDWEGKFADEAMIERLVPEHMEKFKEQPIGKRRFITLRIPNIWEEKTYKLSRAYMSVLSAAEFTDELGLHTPPVFEFILPMTKSADQLIHIQKTFQSVAQLHKEIFDDHEFGKGYIHMVPLFESVDDFYASRSVLNEFIRMHEEHFGFKPPYLRPFIARSDPAMNAGYVPAMLGARMALREFYAAGKAHGLEVHPIIGTGSLPFRGGINPENIKESLAQYVGVRTVTVQSAFRYDYPMEQVKEALRYIEQEFAEPPAVEFSDEEFEALHDLCDGFAGYYRGIVESFAPLINSISASVPARRERVQHRGLFGYGREVGKVSLPRAIKFTAACYSIGLPPEFMGTGRGLRDAKAAGKLELIEKHFFTMRHELKHAGKYLNWDNLKDLAAKEQWAADYLEDVRLCQEILGLELGPSKNHHLLHRNLTANILLKHRMEMDFADDLLEAAVLRKSLG